LIRGVPDTQLSSPNRIPDIIFSTRLILVTRRIIKSWLGKYPVPGVKLNFPWNIPGTRLNKPGTRVINNYKNVCPQSTKTKIFYKFIIVLALHASCYDYKSLRNYTFTDKDLKIELPRTDNKYLVISINFVKWQSYCLSKIYNLLSTIQS